MRVAFCLVGLLSSSALADVTCLKWDLLLNPVGLICHFKPALYTELADAADAAIESTRKALTNLAHFDLTHNPVAVAYEYVQDARAGGLQQANQGLANITNDFEQVTIGFGKDVVNAAMQLHNLADWHDVSQCMIDGSPAVQKHSILPLRFNSNTSFMTQEKAALQVYERCMSAKFSKPLYFNITEPNQQIGASIAEIAPFLEPVSAGADAFKMVIPGSEEATELFALADKPTVDEAINGAVNPSQPKGTFFNTAQEGDNVAAALEDPDFEKANCVSCVPPSEATYDRRALRSGAHQARGLPIRALCCRALAAVAGTAVGTAIRDSDRAAELRQWIRERARQTKSHPSSLKMLQEDGLGPAPLLLARNGQLKEGADALYADWRYYKAGQVSMSAETKEELKDIFPTMKEYFSGRPVSELDPKAGRFTVRTIDMEKIPENQRTPLQKKLLNAAKQMEKDTIPLTADLYACKPEALTTNTEFWLYQPSSARWFGKKSHLYWHIDEGIASFGIADQPGLNIGTGWDNEWPPHLNQGYRAPVREGEYTAWPGGDWNLLGRTTSQRLQPTLHAVYSPETVKEGRLSVVQQVYLKDKVPYLLGGN